MLFQDRLTLDASTRSRNEGYLKVRARSARTGVYQYSGREVDPSNAHSLRDQPVVNVLRDAESVFDRASLASFIAKPITDDHPTVDVTAANWRDHSRGVIMGAVQDGEYVGFDLAFLDAATIRKIDSGKVELSNGYSARLEFGDFRGPNGEICPVRQTDIRGNHVALVDRGRAGSDCRILTDAARCDVAPTPILDSLKEKPVKKILLDGLTVDIADAETAESTIRKLEGERNETRNKLADAEGKVATLTAEKVALEKKVIDTALTPQQLRDAAAGYARTVAKAKALGITVTDAMDEPAIMKAVVDAKDRKSVV